MAHFDDREWPTQDDQFRYPECQEEARGGSMRRRKARVELFEAIRREYEFGVGTIQGAACKFGVHRRMVREALGHAVPAEKPAARRSRPRLGPVVDFIEGILEADRKAPRKQRHTAHRIYVRIGQEYPEIHLAESTVRQYVRERKLALRMLAGETFVPQSYAWGSEAQVDWYEADAELNAQLLQACREDEARILAGRDRTVGSAMLIEKEYLLPLATEDFDLAEVTFPTVNKIGCVK